MSHVLSKAPRDGKKRWVEEERESKQLEKHVMGAQTGGREKCKKCLICVSCVAPFLSNVDQTARRRNGWMACRDVFAECLH